MKTTDSARKRGALLCFLILLSMQQTTGLQSPEYDLLIAGGRIVDGSGNAWFYGDVAVAGDRISRVAPRGVIPRESADRVVDASGYVVSPGFIDIQSHSRGAFLNGDGRVVSKVTQGITTEIMGEGSTNAPGRQFGGPRAFDKWLEAMHAHGTSPNIGSFLGASTVRSFVKGMAEGPATEDELRQMQEIVRDAMLDGAFGIASALIYPPGNYASTRELIEISKAMAPFAGVYITHMRSEADDFLTAIDEAIAIGQGAGVSVEIYHLKAGGRRNWHKSRLAIARINSARDEGFDISANMYPYVAGGTGLTACFPPWAAADGKLQENLTDPEMRTRIKAEVLHQTSSWENLCQLATPEGVLVLGLRKPENRDLAGKTLAEIAREKGKPWIETAMDLVISEQQRVGSIYFMMTEKNLALQMTQPWIKFGTDAGGADPETARGLVHPRAYGTFPRILGKYVREERVMSLEDAVRKMSSAVADRLSIRDRGQVRQGFFADLVIFDPDTVSDRATFEQPHQLSVGIRDVFVNGVEVVKDGKHTGAKPGRVVRGPGYRTATQPPSGHGR